MKEIKIAVTGHRPDKLWGYRNIDTKPEYKRLKEKIKEKILEIAKGYDKVVCITGMALGADIIFANAVLEMWDAGDARLQLDCYIPCANQERMWPRRSQDEYLSIFERADNIVWVSKEDYTEGCMLARNQAMVDACDVVIAIYNGDKKGGTADTVRRVAASGKRVVILNPAEISEEAHSGSAEV